MLRRQIYGAYGGARGVDTAYQGRLTNTDNPIRVLVPVCTITGFSSPESLTAAPPAMVPNRQLLISITFLTVWLAIQSPAEALESVATMIPP